MLEIIILFFIALVLYFDFKARIIPDALNFFFMFLGIALVILQYQFDLAIIARYYLPFFILNIAFAMLMYKLGVWAGGDVKFFMAIMAFLPLYSPFKLTAAFSIFITSALLLIPITMIFYIKELLIYGDEFKKIFVDSILDSARSAVLSFSAVFMLSFVYAKYSSPLVLVFFILASFFIRIPYKIAVPLLLAGFLFFRMEDTLPMLLFLFFAALFLHFMRRSFHLISQEILTKNVQLKDLKEGDIPAQTIYLDGKTVKRWSPGDAFRQLPRLVGGKGISYSEAMLKILPQGRILVDALKARGVTIGEIKQLKRAGVKQILVKESLPFAPVLAAAFLIYRYWDILGIFGLR